MHSINTSEVKNFLVALKELNPKKAEELKETLDEKLNKFAKFESKLICDSKYDISCIMDMYLIYLMII